MTNLFSIPDKEKDYQSFLVFALSLVWVLVIVAIDIVGFSLFPESWMRWLIFLGVAIFVAVSNILLTQLGYVRLASWSLTLMIWMFVAVACFTSGGIAAPNILLQLSIIITAGFLLGSRGGLIICLMTIGIDLALVYLDMIGLLPKSSIFLSPLERWSGTIIPFLTIFVLQFYATRYLHSGLSALKGEIVKREEAEKIKDQTIHNLGERVKDLKTLYLISKLLRSEEVSSENLYGKIAEILPQGWQYSDVAAARVCIADVAYTSDNFLPAKDRLWVDVKTSKGTKVSLEVVYLQQMPAADEGPFLKEERNLIDMLADMISTDLDRREHRTEMKYFKTALDLAAIVSISDLNATFTFVNDNFCKATKYSREELIGAHHNLLWSGVHSPEYFVELGKAMQDGRPHRGEFCNKAKDGTLYWVDATVVPFLDENGDVFQYISINHDITDRKVALEKIRESEQLIRKITSQVPGNTFMFEIEKDGIMKILFVNQGKDLFNPDFDASDLEASASKLRDVLYVDDREKFDNVMKEAHRTLAPIDLQYRIVLKDGVRWRWMQAIAEKGKDGKVLWYGSASDITPLVEYITSIEQMIFDVGHVIRRPISTMLSLTKLIHSSQMSESEIRDISKHLLEVSEEMDKFIRELNEAYQQKRDEAMLNIDISSMINNRSDLFN